MLTSAVTTDTAAVELLSELIRIPSMAPGVEQGVGDGAVAAAVEAFGRANQAAVERQPVLPGRDNVLLSTRAEPGAAVLLIEAHMDTVALGPMTNGLKPWVDDRGCLHGRGACDTKGSLAAALLALQWAVQHPLPHCRLTVCAAVDEEVGGAGARTMAGADRRIDGVIVGEPTHLELVRAHRGGAAWWLSTVGTAGHTSQPELGDNAIYRMADVLQVLREEYPRVLAAKRHPLTGPSTFAVGRIEAGLSGSLNMIPARCTLYVERRPNPGETVDSLIDEFEGLMDIV
ncbi:MAG: M20/M25/M40 family metallo-hydrolase, partial [Actinobacteria bacterium]|nr:M20/M25/M40 family metallo-hydrolase [Actinomycetota bacterium]